MIALEGSRQILRPRTIAICVKIIHDARSTTLSMPDAKTMDIPSVLSRRRTRDPWWPGSGRCRKKSEPGMGISDSNSPGRQCCRDGRWAVYPVPSAAVRVVREVIDVLRRLSAETMPEYFATVAEPCPTCACAWMCAEIQDWRSGSILNVSVEVHGAVLIYEQERCHHQSLRRYFFCAASKPLTSIGPGSMFATANSGK